MRLADVRESRFDRIAQRGISIIEAGNAPRMSFDYNTFKLDPRPDIVVLGTYRHPNTQNNLIGGLNLNYMTDREVKELSTQLPQIVAGGSLYNRYHIGKKLLPSIFNQFYRTYDAAEINSPTAGKVFALPPTQPAQVQQSPQAKQAKQDMPQPMQKASAVTTKPDSQATMLEPPIDFKQPKRPSISHSTRQDTSAASHQNDFPNFDYEADEYPLDLEPIDDIIPELPLDQPDQPNQAPKARTQAAPASGDQEEDELNDDDGLGEFEESISYFDPYTRSMIVEHVKY